MNDVDSLKMELEITRHNRDRDVAYVMKQRDEARTEVERLTKERDEALSASEEYRFDAQRWRDACTRNDERLAELRAENPSRLPSPIDAVVDEILFGDTEHVSPPYNFTPTAHAEKVLVDVAKAAARLGAEEMRGKALDAVSELRARWKKYRDEPLAADNGSWTARWDAAYSLSEDIETNIKALPPIGHEP